MIKATSELPSYQTSFTNGQDVSMADTTSEKGGSSAGFRPDELLEAALASSLNMTIRMFAEEHSIPLTSVSTTVKLDQNYPEEAIFNYSLELAGSLSESDRRLLTEAARSCPVLQTLSKKLSFEA
jgi:putative redox protein